MNKTASPVDPDGLMEFSVVFTDRSLNHMSKAFQGVMTDLSAMLREVYNGATRPIIVPGGGTLCDGGGRPPVRHRRGGHGRSAMAGFPIAGRRSSTSAAFPPKPIVIKASQVGNETTSAFAPQPIDASSPRSARKPARSVVFAPHVETSSGVILPDDYLKAIAEAAHDVGALFVLDCIASGCDLGRHEGDRRRCADLRAAEGLERLAGGGSWSCSANAASTRLERDDGKHELRCGPAQMARHHAGLCRRAATPIIRRCRRIRSRCFATGWSRPAISASKLASDRQWELGQQGPRTLLAGRGFKSVAAPGF
jgi:hypothetical protein